jgi:hypothetical protein
MQIRENMKDGFRKLKTKSTKFSAALHRHHNDADDPRTSCREISRQTGEVSEILAAPNDSALQQQSSQLGTRQLPLPVQAGIQD